MLIDNTNTIINTKVWKDVKDDTFIRIIFDTNSQLFLHIRRLFK
mgnify:FL=1